jgi:hypothetical protein
MPDELNGVETGLHALLHGDAVAAQQAEKMLRWVVSQGSVKAGYHLGMQTSGSVVFSHPTLTLTLTRRSNRRPADRGLLLDVLCFAVRCGGNGSALGPVLAEQGTYPLGLLSV